MPLLVVWPVNIGPTAVVYDAVQCGMMQQWTITSANVMLSTNVCSDFIEEILSPEEDEDGGVRFGGGSCCNSSHFSDNNKSEKNMSDFEGEGVLSDEEIVTLSRSMPAAHDHLGTHAMPSSPRHIPGVAAIYQKHRLHAAIDSAQGWLALLLWIQPTSVSDLVWLYCKLGTRTNQDLGLISSARSVLILKHQCYECDRSIFVSYKFT